MKFAIITDTHWGVRGGSSFFIENQRAFYDDVFFPYLEEHGIKHVIHAGDLFDKRKQIDFDVLSRAREIFFDPLYEKGYNMWIITGNHDVTFKNTNRVNSPDLLLGDYENITTVDVDPMTISGASMDGVRIDLIPWLHNDHYDKIMDFVEKSDSQICVAHLELKGFDMHKGQPSRVGQDASLFKSYDQVFTGHYHTRSKKGNIQYLGAPTEYTWADCGDPRGFHVFETETQELTFIQNPITMFNRILLDRSFKKSMIGEHLEGTYVRLIQTKLVNDETFDKVVEKVMEYNPAELVVVKTTDDSTAESETAIEEDEEIDVVGNTENFIDTYVDGLEEMNKSDRNELKEFTLSLYRESAHG